MKALVLAGGKGTRLRPITHTSAKQLVPLANKPILFYGLEAIAEAGITEVGMIVGDTAAEVKAAVGDGSQFGLKVTYIPQESPAGLAHCVLIAQDFLADDPFVMYLGDNFIVGGISEFVEEFVRKGPNAQVLLAKIDQPERFGVVELDVNGRVERLVEKPKEPKSDLALVGVYLFDRNIHEAVRAIEPSGRGELEITDAIQWLVDNGSNVEAHFINGWWIDTGKVEDLLEANRIVLDQMEGSIEGTVDETSEIAGRVTIARGAEIVRSVIRGPAIIGEGTRIVDSFIGPCSSVHDSCLITDSEIEHSIVLGESVIDGIRRIEGSLIGKNVHIRRAQAQPRAYKFIVGDHSQVFTL